MNRNRRKEKNENENREEKKEGKFLDGVAEKKMNKKMKN